MKVLSKFTLVGLMLSFSELVNAQGIPTYDNMNFINMLKSELNELNQIQQQLTDYQLQLKNLSKLEGTIRNDVLNNVVNQLKNNVNDYGVSELNGVVRANSDPSVYYQQTDSLLKNNIGNTPYDTSTLTNQATNVGLDTTNSAGLYASGVADRKQYERVLDDMRQVSVTRSNSENRQAQANNITQQMATLDSNNTVGALQLVAAQNSLAYAQNEDLIKNQATLIKIQQEQEARRLIENQKAREKELARLNDLKQELGN